MATDRRNRIVAVVALAIPLVWMVPMMFRTDSAGLRYAETAAIAFVIYLVGSKVMEYRDKYRAPRP